MLFFNLRATPVGGVAARSVSAFDYVDNEYRMLDQAAVRQALFGQQVLLVTHGFNVDQNDGLNSIQWWKNFLQLQPACIVVGILWPGDSKYFPVIDYIWEGDEAIHCAKILAEYLDSVLVGATAVSLVSHSLGARVVLETLRHTRIAITDICLMAGAIENDCLFNEYADSAAKPQQIYLLSSRRDYVLKLAFPLGNLIGQIVMHGHPYYRAAIGLVGPAQPIPVQRGDAWQIPESWDYGHGDYLPKNGLGLAFTPPLQKPDKNAPEPATGSNWKPGWSAGAISTLC